jgi:stress response protein YsnF
MVMGGKRDEPDEPKADEHDSGEIETLPDGSLSVPVTEEETVLTKRLKVRERIIIRKSTLVDKHHLGAELRKEKVETEVEQPGEGRPGHGGC